MARASFSLLTDIVAYYLSEPDHNQQDTKSETVTHKSESESSVGAARFLLTDFIILWMDMWDDELEPWVSLTQ
jgi:hypothetical protein